MNDQVQRAIVSAVVPSAANNKEPAPAAPRRLEPRTGDDDSAATLSLKLSRRLAIELMPDFDFRHLGISRLDDPALIMLASYCRQLMALPDGVPAPLTELFARQIRELIGSVLNSSAAIVRVAQFGGVKAARLQSVLHAIRNDLRDPQLSAQAVGKALGLSGRYVQMLLDGAGMSFSIHVRDMRLDEARKLLTAPQTDHLRITDIAYMVGFSDLSYFNREFRKKFGATPREMRRAA